MRRLALLLLLAPLALAPAAHAQSSAAKPAADPAQARFDAAVAEAKTAMMADPNQALAKSEIALSRAAELGQRARGQIAYATGEWLKGESLIYLNKVDEARPVIASALARVLRYAPNTKLHGDLMRSRGAISAIGGKVQPALADFQEAYAIFQRAGEVRSQAIALQDIGQVYWDAGDYERTLRYYSQAGELYTADPAFTLTSHNNRAETLIKLHRYAEAEQQYQLALAAARKMKSPMLEVRILSNLAAALVDHGKLDEAQRVAGQALRLSSSGEAAGWRPLVLGAAAKVAAAQHDYVRASNLLDQTFAGMDLNTTPLPFREFHQVAADVFEKLDRQELALDHLKAYQRLDSEARELTASASSQLMSARFDFANQNLKISQLKQGQLERDIQIERNQARFRTILFAGLTIAAMIVFGLLLIGWRRSKAANKVLTQVNDQLEKALKAKTEFLATTSHEIRTPLNGILGMTQIILANRTLDREMREQVEVVHGAGETMRALVDDILDVAKMETGEVAVLHEETPLRRILEESARLWRGHAQAKGLALELDIAEAPATILSDGARIRQVVFNLLSNAVKFTPAGSVKLSARTEEGDAPQLVIEVADTGIGIPAEHHQAVFEAFHQVDGGTNRQFSGTGLGLAICRNLAEALGGTISLASTPGEGTIFTIRMPLERVEASEAVIAHLPTERPTSLAEARLLLVERNVLTQGVMRSVLEPAVGRLDCAEDGAAALDALRSFATDHLLVEAGSAAIDDLPPLDALRRLIEEAVARDVPVTLLLAPSETLPLGDVAMLGATQLVLKPVGGKQLIATLTDAWAQPLAPAAASDTATSAAA